MLLSWHKAQQYQVPPGTPDSKAGLWPLSSLWWWQWVRSFTNISYAYIFSCICFQFPMSCSTKLQLREGAWCSHSYLWLGGRNDHIISQDDHRRGWRKWRKSLQISWLSPRGSIPLILAQVKALKRKCFTSKKQLRRWLDRFARVDRVDPWITQTKTQGEKWLLGVLLHVCRVSRKLPCIACEHAACNSRRFLKKWQGPSTSEHRHLKVVKQRWTMRTMPLLTLVSVISFYSHLQTFFACKTWTNTLGRSWQNGCAQHATNGR